MKVRKLLTLGLFTMSFCALAMNDSNCSRLRNHGLFKKYKYMGVGSQSWASITTKEGTTKSSGPSSTEGTTYTFDPLATTHNTTSHLQYTSSWGDCAMFGMNQLNDIRTEYIAQNSSAILKEMAQGSGNHLTTLAFYSMCEGAVNDYFSQAVQKNFAHLINENPRQIVGGLNQMIQSDDLFKN